MAEQSSKDILSSIKALESGILKPMAKMLHKLLEDPVLKQAMNYPSSNHTDDSDVSAKH